MVQSHFFRCYRLLPAIVHSSLRTSAERPGVTRHCSSSPTVLQLLDHSRDRKGRGKKVTFRIRKEQLFSEHPPSNVLPPAIRGGQAFCVSGPAMSLRSPREPQLILLQVQVSWDSPDRYPTCIVDLFSYSSLVTCSHVIRLVRSRLSFDRDCQS